VYISRKTNAKLTADNEMAGKLDWQRDVTARMIGHVPNGTLRCVA